MSAVQMPMMSVGKSVAKVQFVVGLYTTQKQAGASTEEVYLVAFGNLVVGIATRRWLSHLQQHSIVISVAAKLPALPLRIAPPSVGPRLMVVIHLM
jgi:hypothetical protein